MEIFSRFDSHEMHSFTMKMHGAARAKHLRRKDEKITDSEGSAEEEDKGEMDNFQDLQLGSITPLVRHGDNVASTSPSDRFSPGHGPTFQTLTSSPRPPHMHVSTTTGQKYTTHVTHYLCVWHLSPADAFYDTTASFLSLEK